MAYITHISSYFPEKVLVNDELVFQHPSWTSEKVFNKLGIKERRVAAENEYASDLAVKAVEQMRSEGQSLDDVDYILYCTQSPDYLIPTTACIIQERLKLSKSAGALDFNLGCSGYVYGLGLAAGLIATGQAKKILFITSETYSKFIAENDISNRLIFGDAATATLITEMKTNQNSLEIGKFVYGTDGSGWTKLKASLGGLKEKIPSNEKTRKDLVMDGPEVMNFALREVPLLMQNLLLKNKLNDLREIDHFIFHQANKIMLDQLEKKLGLASFKVHREFENIGNTVSNTIPIVLEKLMKHNSYQENQTMALVGFGVGFSWGAVILRS